MKKYIYYDEKDQKIVFKCEAKNLWMADLKFNKEVGIIRKRINYICIFADGVKVAY